MIFRYNLRWTYNLQTAYWKSCFCNKCRDYDGSAVNKIIGWKFIVNLHYSFIYPHLLYGIRFWENGSKSYLNWSLVCQNQGFRAGLKIPPTLTITYKFHEYKFHEYKIMPFKMLFKYRLSIFMYTITNNQLVNWWRSSPWPRWPSFPGLSGSSPVGVWWELKWGREGGSLGPAAGAACPRGSMASDPGCLHSGLKLSDQPFCVAWNSFLKQ